MEVYILDSLYRRIELVDNFESCIWTERHSAMGDFELHLQSTLQNRTRFQAGVNLAKNNSYRVMVVETVEDSIDAQGKTTLKVTGRSLEKILDDRLARSALSNTTTLPKWALTGTPKAIATQIFHDICVTGVLDSGDIISGVTEGSIFPADTISAPSDTISIELDVMTVYSATKQVCDLYDMGFRLVRDLDTSNLYYDIYTGSDRTTQQTALAAVVFSPDLDNLQNTTALTTIVGAKNVAYVISPVGHQVVYPTDVDPSIAGFDRHVLIVNATGVNDTDVPTANAKMIQLGKEALSKARSFAGFDGVIDQNTNYVYGTDYNLGDLVELRNIDGATNHMQVTEVICVSDAQGERVYPTLSINEFITPGSWDAWNYNQVWDDLDTGAGLTEYWDDQP